MGLEFAVRSSNSIGEKLSIRKFASLQCVVN